MTTTLLGTPVFDGGFSRTRSPDDVSQMFGRGVANMDITPLGKECRADIELRHVSGRACCGVAISPHASRKAVPRQNRRRLSSRMGNQPRRVPTLGKEITIGAGPAVLMSCADKERWKMLVPTARHAEGAARGSQAFGRGVGGCVMRPFLHRADALRWLKGYLATS
jgi:hypothetical protein